MNRYMDINRIEFVITNACTSRCKHCSLGETLEEKGHIEKEVAVKTVTELSKLYPIHSVMTFGGEPLLHADTVFAIHEAATKCDIPVRQVITNGYFTNDQARILQVAANLKKSGVNSLLLSIDAFHKEYIPLERVYPFAKALYDEQIEDFKLHPAWVVNREHKNKYNAQTEESLAYFEALQIPVSKGNNICPAGNAAVYLSDFYEKKPLEPECDELSCTDCFDEINTLTIQPSGDVKICGFIIGNICKESIVEIVQRFDPNKHPLMSRIIKGGVKELLETAKKDGIKVDSSKHYSGCGVCHEIVKKYNAMQMERNTYESTVSDTCDSIPNI
jgi:MoaA/NifB/PqqE/SkfB family radical SAM enzyme